MSETNQTSIEQQAEVIFGEPYLRRRPFLVIREMMKPAPGVRTEKKGWMKEAGQVQTFEVPSIVDRVSNRNMMEAAVIVDLLNRSIVKNRHAALGTEEQFVEHYLGRYAEQITQGMRIWASRSALDIGSAA